MAGQKQVKIELADRQRVVLERIVRGHTSPQRLVRRARLDFRSGMRYQGWERRRRDTEVKAILGYLCPNCPTLLNSTPQVDNAIASGLLLDRCA